MVKYRIHTWYRKCYNIIITVHLNNDIIVYCCSTHVGLRLIAILSYHRFSFSLYSEESSSITVSSSCTLRLVASAFHITYPFDV